MMKEVDCDMTIYEMKSQLLLALDAGFSEQVELVYKGKVLQNESQTVK